MANPSIWAYTSANAGAYRIDLPEPVSDVQEVFDERDGDSSQNGDFVQQTVDYGGRLGVRIIYERFCDEELAAKFESLYTHLKRGFPIALALNADKAWAGYVAADTLEAGKTGIRTRGNVFYALNSIEHLAAGDYIVLRGQGPSAPTEKLKLTTWDTDTYKAGFGSAHTRYDYETGPIFVRHRDFYPILYLRPEERTRPILTTDRRINWTLDLNMVDAPGDYAALWQETDGEGYQGDPEYQTAGGLAPEVTGYFAPTGDDLSGGTILDESRLRTLQDILNSGHRAGDFFEYGFSGSNYFK